MKPVKSIIVAVVVGLALTACGTKPAEAPQDSESDAPLTPQTVHAAYLPIMTFAPFFVAMDKGYFAEQKITVEAEVAQGGADIVGLLGNGTLDASFAGISAGAIAAVDRDINIKLVLPISQHPEAGKGFAGALMVRNALKDSVLSAKDLRGKKVAINAPGGLASYLLSKTLDKYGLKLGDVTVTYLALPNMTAALQNGAIDAALMGDPYATAAVKAGVAVALPGDSAPTPGLQSSLLFYGPKFIAERKTTAKAFAVAVAKGTRDLAGDGYLKPENLAIINKYTKIDADTIKSMITTTVFSVNPVIDSRVLADQQAFFISEGTLKIASPIPADKLVDNQFSEHVQKVLGPYSAR